MVKQKAPATKHTKITEYSHSAIAVAHLLLDGWVARHPLHRGDGAFDPKHI